MADNLDAPPPPPEDEPPPPPDEEAAAPTAVLMIVYFESMKRLSAQTVLQRVDEATPDVMLKVYADEEKGEEQ